MNDPCLQDNEFQPFILSKVSTILVRLSNHVQFTRVAPPNLYEEFLSNKKVLGHNGHFCLLWVSSNCANKLGKCHIKKFQISKNLKWIAEETNSVDHFILKSVINVITYHKKLGACFLCTQKHVRINIVHAFTEAVYIIIHLIVIQGMLPNTQQAVHLHLLILTFYSISFVSNQ